MSRRVMQHVGIPTYRLSDTQTTIYGFNANGMCLIRKIKLRYHIGDLKSEVCVMSLMLTRLTTCCWDDHESIATPSSYLPFIKMKYADEQGRVRILITERHQFDGVESYFTDFLLY